MSEFSWPAEFLPADAGLRALVLRATGLVTRATPLTVTLLGGDPEPPNPSRAEDSQLIADLATVAADVEALAPLDDNEDEMDRLTLRHGLQRALAAAEADQPDAPAALERHLLARLLRLLHEPGRGMEQLLDLVEHAPAFLRAARPLQTGGSRLAGEVAVEAAGRLPLLLDACAAAGRELAPVALRFRLEAALGVLLQAGAEESGWLLKEYLPGAVDGVVLPPDTVREGLGHDLAELEGLAEAALADAVLIQPTDAPAPPVVHDIADVRRAWDDAAAAAVDRGGRAALDVELLATPAWLLPMVPPLCLALPGPLAEAPARLLVGRGLTGTAVDVTLLRLTEFMPWAEQRGHHRAARLLLPLPDLGEGWRASVRETVPGGEPPWALELAWRAALALASISMTTRGTTVDQAAGLVAAESGMPEATARLQCVHLRRRPLGALTFLAGRSAVAAAVKRVGPGGVLRAGSLSAAAARLLV